MISVKEMRALEINSSALGVSTLLLMENAGRSVKDEIVKRFNVKDKVAYVYVGHGGKGGDGLVAARHLADEGAKVTVILLGENKHEDAILNLNVIEEMDYSITLVKIKDMDELKPISADILIDAMLGTGFSGKPREPFRSAIKAFNNSKGFKVSIDVPSGINADTGEAYEDDYVKPDLVVTFHDIKPGLLKYNFNTVVTKIGIPVEAKIYVGPGDLIVNVRSRPYYSKKGDSGRVLVIGGSYTFSGAPTLAAMGALRAGADLVYVASPEDTARIIAGYSPDLITIKLRGKNISPDNFEELKSWIDRADVVVIGPGMGLAEETIEASKLIVNYLKEKNKLAVIDADALKAISGFDLYENAVITPHAGEFKIFFGEEPNKNIRDRISQVISYAKKCKCTVLLKGYVDIISDGKRFKLNKTGNPGMTVGGSGDTLTGITATLMAQKIEPFIAAYLGVFINSLAGTLAYNRLGAHLTPTDIINEIPNVINNPLDSFKRKLYKRVLS
ncbi:NAD(P)H-hydrate epimerase / ADP-dependent (S)-NAD(P)H-hydrate dehydratase [Saccharolobus shibatae B12]|uniref:Bifunctional NAD(P)H-hydrate repair enzyme n=1 Tax=Saccharolobus shibatae (strain ATCC 51178 / DSM 5389 / JCM 8931 / NBRC 15437 / B12) TaxID=523848 RepID=A0A8F5BN37_SACSH|nr:NAD(P)H-hydrate dehydratase [Saccharolobus shibatae]QXJ28193.1 NAD(P)H-hydrate epimerase / ADP-dependent (S)-NAD(P)H-hydrate dehydratase [Saccharolobus shibatae B12]